MRTQLKFVVLIGVALSVTPIFSSVYAQQSGSQADLFLEMQGLRSEVAELRDMVERQQYQMKKLQRSLERQASQKQGLPGQQQYQNNQQYAQQGASQQGFPDSVDPANPRYTNSSDVNSGGSNYQEQPGVSVGPTITSQGPSVRYSGSSVNPADAPPSNVSLNEEYRSNSAGSIGANSGDLSTSEYPVVNGTVVEERVIGAGRPSVDTSSYPPVVDRSVGGTDSTNIDAQSSVRETGFAGTDQAVSTQYPIDASATPQAPRSGDNRRVNRDFTVTDMPPSASAQAGAGVIAIPNANGSNSPAAGGVQPQLANDRSTALSEQDYYQRGFGLLKESEHSQAVNVFKQQISSYPQGSYADDAHYWIAESMYVNRALDDSKQYFRAIIDNYSQSPRLPDAMLKTAYIEQEQGNVIEARILLQEIIQYHPRSNAAISAKNRLPELK